jgi:hypothetical protein
MKKLILIVGCGISTSFFAQTPLIAHKSHSGSAVSYEIDPSANFGMVAPEIQHIQIINDSTYVKKYGFGQTMYQLDTVKLRLNQIPADLKDSLAKVYHQPIIIDSTQHIQPQTQEAKPINKRVAKPVNKKKSSSLLFILIFVSAGLLTTKIIESFFKEQKSVE